jgi:hypothetical protein
MEETYSTIITPPDVSTYPSHTVLLIDPQPSEIEDVALFLKGATDVYSVYIYLAEMNDYEWLHKIMPDCHAIVVNTLNNEDTRQKDKLAASGKNVWYYGPKNFLSNRNRIEQPIDYFINLLKGN